MNYIASHTAFNDSIDSLRNEFKDDTTNDTIGCGAHDFSRTQSIEIDSDVPITVNDLYNIMEKLKKDYGDFLIELGPDGSFLHKIAYVTFDRTVRLT